MSLADMETKDGAAASMMQVEQSTTNTNDQVVGLDSDETIILRSKNGDGEQSADFIVKKRDAKISTLVATALEKDKEAAVVEINYKASILKLVVEFMKHHQGTDIEPPAKPLRSKIMKEVVKDPWDAEFIESFEKMKTLYDVKVCANYMHINGLLNLCCARVAAQIKGEPLDKIKEKLDPEAPLNKPEGSGPASSQEASQETKMED